MRALTCELRTISLLRDCGLRNADCRLTTGARSGFRGAVGDRTWKFVQRVHGFECGFDVDADEKDARRTGNSLLVRADGDHHGGRARARKFGRGLAADGEV